MSKKKRPLVVVDWVDSAFNQGWKDMSKVYPDVARCRTAGFLVYKSRAVVVVAMDINRENQDAAESMTIPRSCVRKIRKLK